MTPHGITGLERVKLRKIRVVGPGTLVWKK
jgi:hypothetical protein